MSNGLQAYRQLSAGDQAILQVMAVFQKDVNLSELTFLLKDLKAVEPSLWSAMPTQATTRESLRLLAEKQLAVLHTQTMTRVSVVEELTDFYIQQALLSGRLPILYELMRKHRRINSTFNDHRDCDAHPCAIVEFYLGRQEEFYALCKVCEYARNRLIQLSIMETWEPAVFERLPARLQREALSAALTRILICGNAPEQTIEQFKKLVLSDDPATSAWTDLRIQWLMAAGDLVSLDKLAQSPSSAKELAASCAAFLRGDSVQADLCLNRYLASNDRSHTTAAGIVNDMVGLMQLLLVLRQDSAQMRKSLKPFESLRKKPEADQGLPLFDFTKKVLDYLVKMEARDLHKLASYLSNSWDQYTTFTLVFIAHVWRWFLPDHPFPEPILSTRQKEWYRQYGLKWLAALCEDAQSLGKRQSKDEPPSLGSMHKVLGTFAFVEWNKPLEAWKHKLEVLRRLVAPHSTGTVRDADPSAGFDERMIWELEINKSKNRASIYSLRPIIQARSDKGWTKGRPIALSRLYGSEALKELAYLTPQDIAACTCIESYEVDRGRYGYTDTRYSIDYTRCITALIGHPLLYPPDDRSNTLELVKRDPELVIEKKQSGYRLTITPPLASDEPLVLCPEGPHRYAVVIFTPAQTQLAKVLDSGITLPASGQAELLETARALSSVASVQSSISLTTSEVASERAVEHADAVRSVIANSDPLVHLTPHQAGLRAEFFVRPFGSNGPMFTPGSGGKSIFAVIDQQHMTTERDLQTEHERTAKLISLCPSLGVGPDTVVAAVDMPTAEQALELVSELELLKEQGLVSLYWPQGQRLKVAGRADWHQLRINMKSETNWFAASGKLEFSKDIELDLAELAAMISASKSAFVPLSDGRLLRLSEQLRQRVAALAAYSERSGNSLRFPLIRAAALDDIDQWCTLKADKGWKDRQKRIGEANQTEFLIPATLNASLRDYQAIGFQWLCRLAQWGAGACLADDMGLGKTLQAIAVLLHRAAGGPALIVAPTSLGFNWQNELARFASTLNVHDFARGDREAMLSELGARDVVIATYGLLQNESERLSQVQWHTIVLDEAQAIKNADTKRSKAAMELRANFRMILTGTPIENHLGELWNLMQFINPGLLGTSEQFQQRFALPIERDRDRQAQQQLKRLIQPFLLRRTKTEVLSELPARIEVTIGVSLSDEEALLYEAARQRAVKELAEAADQKQGQRLRILAELMRLRRACCHPRLLLPETKLRGAKLEAFSHTIDDLLANQHKALVFSQFVDHLTILREELDRKGVRYQYLDGSTPAKERRRSVDAFQSGAGDVFLISLKAGGTGLNLTAADYVLHMDPWWNPAVEDQAADRAHRIGQLRPVTIYRFITLGTIEEKIVKLHERKRDLAEKLLEGSDTTGSLTAEELLELMNA